MNRCAATHQFIYTPQLAEKPQHSPPRRAGVARKRRGGQAGRNLRRPDHPVCVFASLDAATLQRGGECACRKIWPRKQESTDLLHSPPPPLLWNSKIRIFQRQFPEVLLSDNNDSLVANERRIRFQIHLLRTKYSLIEAPDVTRPGLPVGIRSFSLEESYFRVIHAGIGGHIGRYWRLSIPKRTEQSR